MDKLLREREKILVSSLGKENTGQQTMIELLETQFWHSFPQAKVFGGGQVAELSYDLIAPAEMTYTTERAVAGAVAAKLGFHYWYWNKPNQRLTFNRFVKLNKNEDGTAP